MMKTSNLCILVETFMRRNEILSQFNFIKCLINFASLSIKLTLDTDSDRQKCSNSFSTFANSENPLKNITSTDVCVCECLR